MADICINKIRYTAALAKVRGTYPYISDIADDVPVKSEVDYWTKLCYGQQFLKSYKHNKHLVNRGINLGRQRSSEFSNTSSYSQYLQSPYYHRQQPSESQYHERCVKDARQTKVAAPSQPPMTKAELKKANIVKQDKIWRQAVESEQVGLKKWEQAWGYLTEYDEKGNPIEKEALPESYERFPSGPIPATNSSQYGARINTEMGQKILNLEFQLSKSNKKKKLGSDMICY